jgi:hypothetical protein
MKLIIVIGMFLFIGCSKDKDDAPKQQASAETQTIEYPPPAPWCSIMPWMSTCGGNGLP